MIEDPEGMGEEIEAMLAGLKQRLHHLRFRDVQTDRAIEHVDGCIKDLVELAVTVDPEELGRARERIAWWESRAEMLAEEIEDVERGITTFTELREAIQTLAETRFVG